MDGREIVERFRELDRLAAELSEGIGEFDAAEGWLADGATSMTAWLRAEVGLGRRDASRWATVAARLRSLPVTAAAWSDGSLNGSQVQAIVAHLSPETVDRFAETEARLVPLLASLPAERVAIVMARWRAAFDAAEPDEPHRSLHLSATFEGRHELTGSLDAEGGAIVAAALRVADTDDRTRPAATRRADALVDVCRYFLDHQQAHTGGRHRPHLNVIVDAAHGGRVVDGPVLPRTSVDRLLCDCALHRVVVTGRSSILDYGTSTRTIPVNLWNALVVRDQHCRFPGCDRPSSWCEGHHVVPVTEGGPTRLDNLVLLCSRHHHRLHQPGWAIRLEPDGTVTVGGPTWSRTADPPLVLVA